MSSTLRLTLLISLIQFLSIRAYSQIVCQTAGLSTSEKEELESVWQKTTKNLRRENYDIALNVVIVHGDNSLSSFDEGEVNQLIDNANEYFAEIGLKFSLKDGLINHVHDSYFQDFQFKDDALLRKKYDRLDAINIYFVKNINLEDGSILNGYGNLPTYTVGSNRLMFSYQDNNLEDFKTLRDKTFLHELGHYFGLLHTFQDSNSDDISERELVTRGAGANCNATGDQLCDTPSDPFERLENIAIYDCSGAYPSTLVDINGDTYSSLVNNIMSYHVRCGNQFTVQQYQRMESSLAIRLSSRAEYSITNLDANFVSLEPLEKKSFCTGETISLSLNNTGVYAADNVFILELSDKSGEVFSPIYVSKAEGEMNFKLPINLESGTNYRFRVSSSSPVVEGIPTESFEINNHDLVTLTAIDPAVNQGDVARIQINREGSGLWSFTLTDGTKYVDLSTNSLSIAVRPSLENNLYALQATAEKCAAILNSNAVEIEVVKPLIEIGESFISEHCKGALVQLPITGLNGGSLSEYMIQIEGKSKSYLVKPVITVLGMLFYLPEEMSTENYYELEVLGSSLGDFSTSTNIYVKSAPAQPAVISPVNICFNSQGETLEAIGTDLRWYEGENDQSYFESITPSSAETGVKYYFVSQLSENGCESERSKIEVLVKEPVTATLSGNETIMNGDSTGLRINLTGEAPWQIKLADGTAITSQSSSFEYYVKPSNSTTYALAQVNNNCGKGFVSGQAEIQVLAPLSSEIISRDQELKLFPNPASSYVSIETAGETNGEVPVSILSLNGQKMWMGQTRFLNGKSRVNLPKLATGSYILVLGEADSRLAKKLYIKLNP